MLYDLHLSQPFFWGAEQTCRAIHLLRLICAAVLLFATLTFPKSAPSTEQGMASKERAARAPEPPVEAFTMSDTARRGTRYTAAEKSPVVSGLPRSSLDEAKPQIRNDTKNAVRPIGLAALAGSLSDIPTAHPAKIKAKAARRAIAAAFDPQINKRMIGDVFSVALALRLFVWILSFFILTSEI